ncbi:MAG: polysaccharide pyruvyl transferase family protein [Candidatus Gracilibacteria bacterium]|nr:polysaccharide pyruvyl transferase family protein [Candidatus Gracilibacteria bacterium]
MQISILGSYGEGNFGDEAILDGITVRFPKANIVCFSHNPELSQKLHPKLQIAPMLPAGIRSFWKQIRNGDLKRSKEIIRHSDLVLIGGGGIFYDSKFSSGRNPIKVWHTRVKFLQKLEKSFQLYAVGVSKLEKEVSQKLMRKICKAAAKVSVRDLGSERNLRAIGVNKEITLVRDPAFDFPTKANKKITHTFTVGISLRAWQDTQKTFQRVTKELESIEGPCQLKLIPMSIGQDDDRIVLSEFKSSLPAGLKSQTELVEIKTPQEAYQEIAGLDLLIGMRLHSLIFAKLANVRSIPLYYDEKVREVLS